jgi:hypothetical protein
MEQAHWLMRKRSSVAMAKKALTARARLAHYELAGRYSVKAAAAEQVQLHVQDSPPTRTDLTASDFFAVAR